MDLTLFTSFTGHCNAFTVRTMTFLRRFIP